MRKNEVLNCKAWGGILFCIGMNGAAFSHSALIELSRSQYFENEVAIARIVLDKQTLDRKFDRLEVTWSILGKELKKESLNKGNAVEGSEFFFNFKLPEKVRAETRLTLTFSGRLAPENETETLDKLTLLIYPKNAEYYMDPKEWQGRKIALFDPGHSLHKFLKNLNLQFDSMDHLDRLNYKKYDLLIISSDSPAGDIDSGVNAITLVPFGDEPWARLYATYLIRQGLKKNLEEKFK